MFIPKYKIYFNNKYFDSLYTIDYYNDKKIFYDTGARQFFTIYQIVSHKTHLMEIEEVSAGIKTRVKDEYDFKDWVKKNYPMYLNCLENYN